MVSEPVDTLQQTGAILETINLSRAALVTLSRAGLCILLCAFAISFAHGQAPAKPRPQDIKLVKSTLAKLANIEDINDVVRAQNAINELIRHDTSRNHFAHTVLVSKLFIAVTQRLEDFPEENQSNEDLSAILSLGSSDLLGTSSLFDEQSERTTDTKIASPKDSLSKQDKRLKRDLAKIEVASQRKLYKYYRTFFTGVDDLKRILEKATNDKNRQTETFNRLVTEFEILDKQHDIIGRKLRRK
jgi:hypothetical protein